MAEIHIRNILGVVAVRLVNVPEAELADVARQVQAHLDAMPLFGVPQSHAHRPISPNLTRK